MEKENNSEIRISKHEYEKSEVLKGIKTSYRIIFKATVSRMLNEISNNKNRPDYVYHQLEMMDHTSSSIMETQIAKQLLDIFKETKLEDIDDILSLTSKIKINEIHMNTVINKISECRTDLDTFNVINEIW